MQPINKDRLTHDIIYKEYIDDTGTGDSYKAPRMITFVRFEKKRIRVENKDGYNSISSGLIMIDKVNSKIDGEPITDDLFVNNSEIIYNGKTYILNSFEMFRTTRAKNVHHYELEVI